MLGEKAQMVGNDGQTPETEDVLCVITATTELLRVHPLSPVQACWGDAHQSWPELARCCPVANWKLHLALASNLKPRSLPEATPSKASQSQANVCKPFGCGPAKQQQSVQPNNLRAGQQLWINTDLVVASGLRAKQLAPWRDVWDSQRCSDSKPANLMLAWFLNRRRE